MNIEINGHKVKFIADAVATKEIKKKLGDDLFNKQYQKVDSKIAPDLEGYHVKDEFASVIQDLVSNQQRANVFTRTSHFFKRRQLLKSWIMWKNDLVQMGIADPRSFKLIPEAMDAMKNNDPRVLNYDRLDLYNAMIGVKDSVKQQVTDIRDFYGSTAIFKKIDKLTGGTGSFVKKMNELIDSGYLKLQDITWAGDKAMRTALAMQFEKNGMSAEEAVRKTQLFMAHYSRMTTRARRILSIPIMFATYRLQMLRLHRQMLTNPKKYWKNIMSSFLIKMTTVGAMGALGYNPVRSGVSNFFELEGIPADIANHTLQYRFQKIDKETGETKIVTHSMPVFELDKYLNRNIFTTFKYNAGVFPGLFMQLIENKGLDNKPITDVPLTELVAGLREGVYTRKDKWRWIGQSGLFASKQYLPITRDVENIGNLIAGKSEIGAIREMLNLTALAFTYNYTRDINIIRREIEKEEAKGEVNNIRLERLRIEFKRVSKFLRALQMQKEDGVPLHKAKRIVQLSGNKGRLTRSEEAELSRLIGEDDDADAGFR